MDERKEKRRQIFRKCADVFGIALLVLEVTIIVAVFWFGFSLMGSEDEPPSDEGGGKNL